MTTAETNSEATPPQNPVVPEEAVQAQEKEVAEVQAEAPVSDEQEAEEEEEEVQIDSDNYIDPEDCPDGKWYVVNTYSGYEKQAKASLLERVKSKKMESFFGGVLIPSENVVEMVKGKKRNVNKRFFPGYILVKMILNDDSWHLVKNTPKVTGFVGGKVTPPAVPEHEVAKLTRQIADGTLRPKHSVSFEKGESVRVIEGPFINFNGIVDEVRPEKGKLRVLVSIFGRSTPVELDFIQVEKN